MKKVLFSVGMLLATALLYAQLPPDSIFSRHFKQAQAFANACPREKVHLHFDNTSYYLGDTIWFKAYVALAEKNVPTFLSKPLYVELLDQLGNVAERQIIQLENGTGHGQIVLNSSFFTGYYEVRAYTKWMLAFEEPQYFSRTLPIYRKRLNAQESSRSIASYNMDESMKQRPNDKKKNFTLRFFPEGGQLVKGIRSVVAFEADSKEKGLVATEGIVRSATGEVLTQLRTLHNGMGYFLYEPGEKPAKVEVTFEGKNYIFDLPQALPQGYTLRVDNRQDVLDVTVTRSSLELTDTLALFASSQGRPHMYAVVNFDNRQSRRIQIPAADLPGGVVQLSLITQQGVTLCDRHCYLMPQSSVQVNGQVDSGIYGPFAPIDCRINVIDAQKRPVQTEFSISIRDGMTSDYQQYDNSIYTDLLLTSDLKGYIHQPGFYFADQSAGRRKMLDVLLLVRGWRKYDMSQAINTHSVRPQYAPESKLTLYGRVKSLLGKVQRNIGVSILARRDSVSIAGMTKTDSLGYFHVPVDGFEGTMNAFIQTRNEGKQMNKQTAVSLFRNFEPPLRKLDFAELNPVWTSPEDLERLLAKSDSLYQDSILGPNNHLLDEVVVRAKWLQRMLEQTERFEKQIWGYYNLTQIVDKMRDDGETVYSLPLLLEKLNPNIRSSIEDSQYLTYNNSSLMYVVNGRVMTDVGLFLGKDVDPIKSIMLYLDQAGGESIYVMNNKSNRVVKLGAKDFWKGADEEANAEDVFKADASLEEMASLGITQNRENRSFSEQELNGSDSEKESEAESKPEDKQPVSTTARNAMVVCSITTIDDWDPEKTYKARHGIRYTYIQGYNKPAEFYSPAYPGGAPAYTEDQRRTLYWNPSVKTNEQGEAIIRCYNSGASAPVTIIVETLHEGCPAALEFHSRVKL